MSYPAALFLRARRLREAGFSAAGIRRVFRSEGIDPVPSLSTIKRWTRDEASARERAESRRHNVAIRRALDAGGGILRVNSLSDVRLHTQVEMCGLRVEDAAKVMTLDAPDHPMSPEVAMAKLDLRRCTACGEVFKPPGRRSGPARSRCHACHRNRTATLGRSSRQPPR